MAGTFRFVKILVEIKGCDDVYYNFYWPQMKLCFVTFLIILSYIVLLRFWSSFCTLFCYDFDHHFVNCFVTFLIIILYIVLFKSYFALEPWCTIKWNTNEMQMKYKWNTIEIQLKYKWNTNEIQLKYKWNTNEIQMKYKWNTNEIQMKYRLNTNEIQMKYKWNTN